MADGNVAALVPQQQRSVIETMAAKFGMSSKPFELALRSAMPAGHSDVEFAACALVANQYDLNPFTKQIYFMRTKSGQIQPIVSVDGWAWIVNRNEAHDGMEFVDHFDDKKKLTAITCRIYRKDRSKPVEVTEYMAECVGQSPAWKQTPSRMLRHRAMIQCARLAFGFSGIFEQDEAERIIEADAPKRIDPETGEVTAILFDVIAALDAVETCADSESLATVWKAEGAKAVAAKDKSGHAALKAAVLAKKAAIEAKPQDAEIIEAEEVPA